MITSKQHLPRKVLTGCGKPCQLLTAGHKVQFGADTFSDVFAVVDQPVHAYLACVRVVNDRAA
ncbi:hypothetical protein [Streptomyces lydicus]|uniref:hypothetical protein n=1 Tax=Streptomyces lydicus TaxID=47763 RepID=UPI0037A10D6E